MSDLQDFIAEMHGIRLHRRRKLTAFSHVSEGPLLEMLFKVTRPAALPTQVGAQHLAHHAPAVPAPVIARKGMVDYHRELHGFSDESETRS